MTRTRLRLSARCKTTGLCETGGVTPPNSSGTALPPGLLYLCIYPSLPLLSCFLHALSLPLLDRWTSAFWFHPFAASMAGSSGSGGIRVVCYCCWSFCTLCCFCVLNIC
ncbi:hypothetical protein FKM82_023714 [Ascaphus truei]